ncbi:MAG: pyridoxamine 5'-phosphate oxidase [Balneola sp.]|nr:MAG: pyridoxamine 5'-phosphate oxidase [Balneola sp.]
MNPISKFEEWYKEELFKSSVQIPSACCLSTIGLDGYPNARFVSLKAVYEGNFIITGPTNSSKGLELKAIPKASLTFWWTETERQVRIQGDVEPLEADIAGRFFEERNFDSKVVSVVSEQSSPVSDTNQLIEQFNSKREELKGTEVPVPEHWGGFKINPLKIEFLEFSESRFHDRTLFTMDSQNWVIKKLQP